MNREIDSSAAVGISRAGNLFHVLRSGHRQASMTVSWEGLHPPRGLIVSVRVREVIIQHNQPLSLNDDCLGHGNTTSNVHCPRIVPWQVRSMHLSALLNDIIPRRQMTDTQFQQGRDDMHFPWRNEQRMESWHTPTVSTSLRFQPSKDLSIVSIPPLPWLQNICPKMGIVWDEERS